MKKLLALFTALTMLAGAQAALASSEGAALKEVQIPSDNESRQRGAAVVMETCMMCHSLKYIGFKDLTAIGMTNEDIEGYLTGQDIGDKMMSLTPIEDRKESYGKVPPDLSLMAIARKKGPRYVYTLLTSYYYNEEGDSENHLFHGIKMPDIFSYADTEEGSEERAAIEAQVKDVSAFLVWAADPNAEFRRTTGVWVIVYLIIMTTLLYLVKKRIWRNVHDD